MGRALQPHCPTVSAREARAAAIPFEYRFTDEQLRRMQFRRRHEDFMRAEGFPGWEWPVDVGRASDADMFEEWLIARWLAHMRSPEYRKTTDYWFLRAEFERQP